MRMLCLVGKKRCGKDTAADAILQKFGGVKYQLAAPIKEMLFYTCPLDMPMSNFEGLDYDREQELPINIFQGVSWLHAAVERFCIKYPTLTIPKQYITKAIDDAMLEKIQNDKGFNCKWSVRHLMQTLGTDIMVNQINQQFWNQLMMIDFTKRIMQNGFFVVSDIRQVHEIELMRKLNTPIIHLERPDNVSERVDQHITERGLPRLDNEPIIINNSTIESYQQTVIEIVKQYK